MRESPFAPGEVILDGDEVFGVGHRTEDNNVVKVRDHYYMFKASGVSDQLSMRTHLLVADSIRGPWRKHQDEPVFSRDTFNRGEPVKVFGDEIYYGARLVTSVDAFPGGWRHISREPLLEDGVSRSFSDLDVDGEGYSYVYFKVMQGEDGPKHAEYHVAWSREIFRGPYERRLKVLSQGLPGAWDEHRVGQVEMTYVDGEVVVCYEGLGYVDGALRWQPGFVLGNVRRKFFDERVLEEYECHSLANPSLFVEDGVLHLLVDGRDRREGKWRRTFLFSCEAAEFVRWAAECSPQS